MRAVFLLYRFFLLAFFLGLAVPVGAQTIAGFITDAQTKQAVPFVNIGVLGKTVGTVADEQGAYQLITTGAVATDTVRLSSIGYEARRLLLRELLAQPTIALKPETVVLGEVRVQAKGVYKRTHTLGNTTNSESATLTLSADDLGAEIGTVISLKRRPTKVLNANFMVAHNRAGALTFRVNLYRLLPTGKPSDVKLLTRNIIVTSRVSKGPITVDLTSDQLVVDEDFFLTLEWIGGADARQVSSKLAFSAGIGYVNNDLYLRQTSQAPWERASAGAVLAGMQPKISFYVTVQD